MCGLQLPMLLGRLCTLSQVTSPPTHAARTLLESVLSFFPLTLRLRLTPFSLPSRLSRAPSGSCLLQDPPPSFLLLDFVCFRSLVLPSPWNPLLVRSTPSIISESCVVFTQSSRLIWPALLYLDDSTLTTWGACLESDYLANQPALHLPCPALNP